jgi:hypothetical protein
VKGISVSTFWNSILRAERLKSTRVFATQIARQDSTSKIVSGRTGGKEQLRRTERSSRDNGLALPNDLIY